MIISSEQGRRETYLQRFWGSLLHYRRDACLPLPMFGSFHLYPSKKNKLLGIANDS